MASIESTLTELLEKGVGPITVGVPPPNSGPPKSLPRFFITADHNIATGVVGNTLQSRHQSVGESVSDCLNKLVEMVDKVEGLEVKPSSIVGIAPPPKIVASSN